MGPAHLPTRQRSGELMRSKVRGRRWADNLLALQAAGGMREAEGRHLPLLLPSIFSLIMRLLLARCLTARASSSCLFILPIPTCGYGSGESERNNHALALWFSSGLQWEGGMVLTLLVEEMVLLCSLPVHPCYISGRFLARCSLV